MKFTEIRETTDKLYEIYSKGCNEGPFKVTRIAKITKFTITAKFTIIRLSIHEMHKSLWKGYMEVPNAIYENYEFYEIS